MSEQTTDTHNSASDGQDPSMEDILASIRKIIAEDDAPSDIGSNKSELAVSEDITGDVSNLAQTDVLDLDIVEDAALDTTHMNEPSFAASVDSLIGDKDPHGRADLEIPELEVQAHEEVSLDYEGGSNDVLDLLIPMEEESSEADSPDEVETAAPETVSALDDLSLLVDDVVTDDTPELETVESLQIEPPEDDLSALLDNMLEDSSSFSESEIIDTEDAPNTHEVVIDPAADLLEDLLEDEDSLSELDTSEIAAETEASTIDPDMMLVKSLMADLTEEPLHDAELSQTREDPEVVQMLNPEPQDNETSDVLDDILSITLDDETQLSEEAVAADVEMASEIQETQETARVETTSEAALSLKEIAAQAEADAQSADAGLVTAAAATVGAAALISSADDAHDDSDADIEEAAAELNELIDEAPETHEDLTPEATDTTDPESTTEETSQMPRAKKTDAIIDEVTESATAGAFASLTNVVEEKAVVAERGDRIGDLVMEALQPMLKEWLDANLKGIVERAVTKEVKRISSGK